ncbi:sensor histidine kinase [Saliterribacillus persicus]|uniref:histidine kinase n=1 Tax=Saliterribacillus persicus TaxID=930114 RepID=A0A368XZ42_9BACI|nr:sensor histidine kinase [Saliterribacillus persicus]RCW73253.1 histidine kinase/DNA gyrase B/HSP90-like ATPase [Saliterribacillus persicus]
MIKIRTKLLIYFVAVLLLVVLLFFVREESARQVMELHDESSSQYFLLNEITKVTDQTFQSLQIYVHEPSDDNLVFYSEDKQKLIDLQAEYEKMEVIGVEEKNFLSMLSSFLELTDKTAAWVGEEEIEQYSYYLNEADNTANYIHEMTLELINQELTDYQNVLALEDQKMESTKNMGTAIFLAIIIGSVTFAIWFSNGLTRTIDRLTGAAKEISAGNYTGDDVVVSGKDELKILTETFNQMKRNILQSVNEMEEKARLSHLLKEMELKSLQNQINPHFLFNTLNTISKMSYIEGAEKTTDLISSVSALLRYNIGVLDRETVLKDEVEIVREYFFIQKTRFGDRVAFHQNIDEACLDTPIPCLTLQPIMENAFMHGIEEIAQGAEITLHIYQQHDMINIDIWDNGVGMDKETINHLLGAKTKVEESAQENKRVGHSTGIGMRNVMDRLELFDQNSQFQVQSELGKGTKVSIQLPKK